MIMYMWSKKESKAFLETFNKIKEEASLEEKSYMQNYLKDW